VGVKICRGLLEKIKFDLVVARTDNDVDMRYLINMDYSADLPINTMGRRIRTRLYFTSESHLHTVLNVLRFGSGCQTGKPMLSDAGVAFINSSPELCYLTQIVIRVFEDTRLRSINDPRRFRVEILFSPGATAPPRHLQELERDLDTSRFETAPLKIIGRDGLTCEELEAFFGAAIQAGKPEHSEEHVDMMSQSTHPHSALQPMGKHLSQVSTKNGTVSQPPYDITAAPNTKDRNDESNRSEQRSTSVVDDNVKSGENVQPDSHDKVVSDPTKVEYERATTAIPTTDKKIGQYRHNNDNAVRRTWSRRLKWRTVASSCLALGTGCVIFAMYLTSKIKSRRGMIGGNVRR
jgi:Histidine phosphatase superfamily (branch 2)